MKARILLPLACAAVLIASAASAQPRSPFLAATCDPSAATFNDVRLPQAVIADGNPLGADTYQVRITTDRPSPAVGQSPTGECWVEFVKSGNVAGRELASVVPADEIGQVTKGPEPKLNEARVDLLKSGEYLPVWIHSGGTHYIINLSVQR